MRYDGNLLPSPITPIIAVRRSEDFTRPFDSSLKPLLIDKKQTFSIVRLISLLNALLDLKPVQIH
jgi:hypothetical protein